MQLKFELRRSSFSTLTLVLFMAVLGLSALLSEFFRAPMKRDNIISEYRSLFKEADFNAVNKLKFKNSLGEISLLKKGQDWEIHHPRELPVRQEIIQNILDGKNNQQICDELYLSFHTVKNHIYTIYKKMDVKSRIIRLRFTSVS